MSVKTKGIDCLIAEFKQDFKNGSVDPHTPGAFVRMCKERGCGRGHLQSAGTKGVVARGFSSR
jgi:hypothetical protein